MGSSLRRLVAFALTVAASASFGDAADPAVAWIDAATPEELKHCALPWAVPERNTMGPEEAMRECARWRVSTRQ